VLDLELLVYAALAVLRAPVTRDGSPLASFQVRQSSATSRRQAAFVARP
jgi:hypothetical protein